MSVSVSAMAGQIDRERFPWDWIGLQGSGQVPMTQSQMEWLERRGLTREEYLSALAAHRRELGVVDPPEDRSNVGWRSVTKD